jgi:hypothetical protein
MQGSGTTTAPSATTDPSTSSSTLGTARAPRSDRN